MTSETYRGATIEKWAALADALGERSSDLFNALKGLRSMVAVPAGHELDDVRITVADRILQSAPDADQRAGERLKLLIERDDCEQPEGTLSALVTCASMLETWGPECFPANEKGQVAFARAMMDSTAAEIRAYVANATSP